MVGKDSPTPDIIQFSSEADDEMVINVQFPYSSSAGEDDPTASVSDAPLKIDYSTITVPPPKKTISIRRAWPQRSSKSASRSRMTGFWRASKRKLSL